MAATRIAATPRTTVKSTRLTALPRGMQRFMLIPLLRHYRLVCFILEAKNRHFFDFSRVLLR
jgi:hypothetical protein